MIISKKTADFLEKWEGCWYKYVSFQEMYFEDIKPPLSWKTNSEFVLNGKSFQDRILYSKSTEIVDKYSYSFLYIQITKMASFVGTSCLYF